MDRTHYVEHKMEGLKCDLILLELSQQCLREWYDILHLRTQVIIDSYDLRRSDLQFQAITTDQQFKGILWRNILWIFLAKMNFQPDSLEVIPKVEEWATMYSIKKVLSLHHLHNSSTWLNFRISVGSSDYSDHGTFQCTSTSPSHRGNHRKIATRSFDGGM